MLFSPAERILLLNILPPAEGNAMFLRSVRRLRAKLAFSESEIRDWKITSPGPGRFLWDTSKAVPVEIEMPPTAHEYVAACLQQADAGGKLHEGMMDVFDKFFPEA